MPVLDPVDFSSVKIPGVDVAGQAPATNHWDWWPRHCATQSTSNQNSWGTNCTHNGAWWNNTGCTTNGNCRAAKIDESQISA
jgi:hypothetical protein